MKDNIHPEYNSIKAVCSCGNVLEVFSTLKKDLHLDICSSCHPFYTSEQKEAITGGRIDRFNKRFGNFSVKK